VSSAFSGGRGPAGLASRLPVIPPLRQPFPREEYRMSRLLHLWPLVFVILLAAQPSFAQGTTGAIEGKVVDDQGGALPGANVTAKNEATGLSRSAVSDSTGIYRLPGLPVGTYEVKVDLAGFAPSTRRVVVNVGA